MGDKPLQPGPVQEACELLGYQGPFDVPAGRMNEVIYLAKKIGD